MWVMMRARVAASLGWDMLLNEIRAGRECGDASRDLNCG